MTCLLMRSWASWNEVPILISASKKDWFFSKGWGDKTVKKICFSELGTPNPALHLIGTYLPCGVPVAL